MMDELLSFLNSLENCKTVDSVAVRTRFAQYCDMVTATVPSLMSLYAIKESLACAEEQDEEYERQLSYRCAIEYGFHKESSKRCDARKRVAERMSMGATVSSCAITRICPGCGVEFMIPHDKKGRLRVYHSDGCADAARWRQRRFRLSKNITEKA